MKKLFFATLLIPALLISCFDDGEDCGPVTSAIDVTSFNGMFNHPTVETAKTRAGDNFEDVWMSLFCCMDLNGTWRTVFSGKDLYNSDLTDLMSGEGGLRFWCYDISPDGKRLLIEYQKANENTAVREYDVTTGSFSPAIYNGQYGIYIESMAYDNSGNRIAYVEGSEGGYELTVINRDGSGKIKVCDDLELIFGEDEQSRSDYGYCPAFTPDDSRVMVTGSQGIALFPVAASATAATVWSAVQEQGRVAQGITLQGMEGGLPFSASRAVYCSDWYESVGGGSWYATISAVNYSNAGAAATPAAATLLTPESGHRFGLPSLTRDAKILGCEDFDRSGDISIYKFKTWNFDGQSSVSGMRTYNFPQGFYPEEGWQSATFKAIDKAYFESCPQTVIPERPRLL